MPVSYTHLDVYKRQVAIREMYPKAHFVTIFAKPAGRPLVDDYVVDIPQDTWIEQPWDCLLYTSRCV